MGLPAIILFAKAPVPGSVKTRLLPALTAEASASLHEAFVADLLEHLRQIDDATLELHLNAHAVVWPGFGGKRALQAEGDLGRKLLLAMTAALSAGARSALVLGSDAPTLPLDHIRALLAAPADVALGPAEDGGFWGIHCRITHPAMFDGVEWSSPATLHQTVRAIAGCGLAASLGPLWFDVDEPKDLQRLLASGALPRHTAEWAAAHRLLLPGSIHRS